MQANALFYGTPLLSRACYLIPFHSGSEVYPLNDDSAALSFGPDVGNSAYCKYLHVVQELHSWLVVGSRRPSIVDKHSQKAGAGCCASPLPNCFSGCSRPSAKGNFAFPQGCFQTRVPCSTPELLKRALLFGRVLGFGPSGLNSCPSSAFFFSLSLFLSSQLLLLHFIAKSSLSSILCFFFYK